MSRTRAQKEDKAGPFFLATLVLWFVSVLFEILFHRRSQLLSIVAGCFFYQLANWVVRAFVSRDPLFVNTSVSLLHSTITSSSEVEDMKISYAKMQSQWDMLHYGLYSGWIPSILMHHLILLICFTLALYRNVTINYLILTLICELHSIFLHVRKVRRMAGVRDAKSKIVMAEWVLNVVTYIVARAGAHLLITAKLIWDAPKLERALSCHLHCLGCSE
ncbi:TLC domain-containing protein 2 [Prunus yedoensis var. nudiflora]|uniref:TLC domain-containing protein 2 n=1 Tax=Prunus yedoensis var. nudiflora TaxID=2094558 RepID=A0A314Y447_PRUYE|nr:TLC domain-containing protein 2 [Prunus yedoensis var. nudiflora]